MIALQSRPFARRALPSPFALAVLVAVGAVTAGGFPVVLRAVSPLPDVRAESRTFEFKYSVAIESIEEGQGPVHVFLPLAAETPQQRVVSERIDTSIPGAVEVEGRYGNRYWHGTVAVSDGAPIRVTTTTVVQRRVSVLAAPASSMALAEERRAEFELLLGPNAYVAVGHPMLDPLLVEVRQGAKASDKAAMARAIYDWVVDNVEYKKVGSGWGNGDTFWACSERYGNCTDFHALFISLARTEGIPARFEIGFPIPEDRDTGTIGGYHCWVEFYLPEVGWFPIDASEAFKHPGKREFFYGTHPADRIQFTTGRDLRLGEDHRGSPLNYFVYPYVEVAGTAWEGSIDKTFTYTDRKPPVRAER